MGSRLTLRHAPCGPDGGHPARVRAIGDRLTCSMKGFLMTIASILIAAGSAFFLVLGVLHAQLTIRDEREPRAFAPRDPDLLKAMQDGQMRLTAETTIWCAGLGFHYSHSLALIGFGLLFGCFALFAWPALLSLPVLLWAAPVIGLLYLVMAWRYWFRIPVIGAGLGFVLMTAGVVLA